MLHVTVIGTSVKLFWIGIFEFKINSFYQDAATSVEIHSWTQCLEKVLNSWDTGSRIDR